MIKQTIDLRYLADWQLSVSSTLRPLVHIIHCGQFLDLCTCVFLKSRDLNCAWQVRAVLWLQQNIETSLTPSKLFNLINYWENTREGVEGMKSWNMNAWTFQNKIRSFSPERASWASKNVLRPPFTYAKLPSFFLVACFFRLLAATFSCSKLKKQKKTNAEWWCHSITSIKFHCFCISLIHCLVYKLPQIQKRLIIPVQNDISRTYRAVQHKKLNRHNDDARLICTKGK